MSDFSEEVRPTRTKAEADLLLYKMGALTAEELVMGLYGESLRELERQVDALVDSMTLHTARPEDLDAIVGLVGLK